MTTQELAQKGYNGSLSHPVCEIEKCFETDLHDIVLTEFNGVYLLCKKHFAEYMRLSGDKLHAEWKARQGESQ